jgi:hypothetical protein
VVTAPPPGHGAAVAAAAARARAAAAASQPRAASRQQQHAARVRTVRTNSEQDERVLDLAAAGGCARAALLRPAVIADAMAMAPRGDDAMAMAGACSLPGRRRCRRRHRSQDEASSDLRHGG